MMNLSETRPARILVTGACGQIGAELVPALCGKYGADGVMATDILAAPKQAFACAYLPLNVLNQADLEGLIARQRITQVYHLAAVLSASGEQNPLLGWDLNMRGLLHVLEIGRKYALDKIFWPSSIAVFGQASGKTVFQQTLTDPATVYGISKVAGEQWCRYYHLKYGLDVRSIRYPGLISYSAAPGGGTTDYAVAIFHAALSEGHYDCYLSEGTRLPMMYMADAIRATVALMEAPAQNISVRTAYNLGAMDFTPGELAAQLTGSLPAFKVTYSPDFRQQIADSWPSRIMDVEARRDWGWEPLFDLSTMVKTMLAGLEKKQALPYA